MNRSFFNISLPKYDLSFLFGLTISAFFVEALIPAKGLALLLSIYFIFTSWKAERMTLLSLKPKVRFSFYFILLLGVYTLALWLTPYYFKRNAFFLLQAFLIYCVYLSAPKRIDDEKLWRGFFYVFLPLSLIVAIFGIVKAVLIARGYFLEPLYLLNNIFNLEYPPGSSVRSDYNLFSIAMLICTFFILSRDIFTRVNKYIYTLSVLGLLFCCYYSGSRRSILFMVALPFVLLAYKHVSQMQVRKNVSKIALHSVAIALFLYLSGIFVLTGVRHYSYQLWPNFSNTPSVEWIRQGIFPVVPFPDWGEELLRDLNMTKSNSHGKDSPNASPLTFQARSYATNERSVRWNYAWEMAKQMNFILPWGFSYLEKFGCRFQDCKIYDYPHNVLLSELLVAGLLSLGLCIGLFFRHAVNLASIQLIDTKRKLFVLSFFTFPNLLISGDYLFTSGMAVAVLTLGFALCFQQNQRMKLSE